MTDWMPGIVTFGVGVAAGTIALLSARKNKSEPDSFDALKVRADKAIEALRELNADKHHYEEADFQAEKARLEREAADALRERDRAKAQPKKRASGAVEERKGWAARNPQIVGGLYGASLVGFLWLLFALMSAESTQKPVPVAGDDRSEALLVLSAISISIGDSEKILQFWQGYMQQQPPRHRPPMLQKAYDWLEKAISGQE